MLTAGDRVERLQIIERVGQGGMADVYRARHLTLGTDFALKVLTLRGPSLRERLVAEGQAQAQLQHPNIVRVIDVVEVGDTLGLVMDFVEGPDLKRWIAEERPDAARAEAVFRDIVAGVAAAHAADRVHRDLKPGNVLMARDHTGAWVAKVTDFGLVKALGSGGAGGAYTTRAGTPMGTPAYMAPEQQKDAGRVDARADLFSLGCILFELLAHQPAFGGANLFEVLERVHHGRREPLPPGVPSRLAKVVDACLQVDPADRPLDCAAVLSLLEVAPTHPTLAPVAELALTQPPSAPGRSTAPLALVATVAAVLGLGSVTIAGVAAVLLWRPEPTEVASDPNATCPTEGGDLGYARGPSVFLKSPGQRWIVRGDTPVFTQPNAASQQVCMLPGGTHADVLEAPIRVGGTWLKVRGDAWIPPANHAEVPPE